MSRLDLKKSSGIQKAAYGHVWEWRPANVMMRDHWKSTSGNLVMIFPPDECTPSWYVNVCDDEVLEFAGNDAAERAFCIAEGFTRQQR